MGYETKFDGKLKFTTELKASQIVSLDNYLGEDIREHKEWNYNAKDFNYIDLDLLDDFTGLEWNGAEKTYGMTEQINFIITKMREFMPSFGLEGKIIAQGEAIDDRYEIKMVDNVAVERELQTAGSIIECPDCGARFELE